MKSLIVITILLGLILLQSCAPGPLISKGEAFKSLNQVTFSAAEDKYPAVDSTSKRILFVSERDGDYNIYLKNNPLSKSVIKKTSHGGTDTYPCFSPDGSKFCFASNRNGNYDIFVMNVEKGFAKTQITSSENDELLPDWSPDGKRIAFCQYSKIDGEWYIWIKNLESGQLTQITNGLNPIFSKNGKKIFFKRAPKTYYELWRVDLNGDNETQFISDDEWGVASYCLNPKGDKLIFSTTKNYSYYSREDMEGNDLWLLDLESGDQTQLTTHDGSDYSPVWSSDGQIYFTTERLGEVNIWSFKSEFE